MSDEEWRPVVGWEGLYEVSDRGRVRSVKGSHRRHTGRVLKQFTSEEGYKRVGLSDKEKNVRRSVHRLVCEAFYGTPPEGREYALHWDGDPSNNSKENLRWGSHSENMLDSVRHGTHHMSRRTHCPRGHQYNLETTYVGRERTRGCKKCHLEDVKRAYRGGLPEGDPRHGTNNGYANRGCRCEKCLDARREYLKGRKL